MDISFEQLRWALLIFGIMLVIAPLVMNHLIFTIESMKWKIISMGLILLYEGVGFCGIWAITSFIEL